MLSVERLRCEYLQNPLGIDVLAPRLSWELSSLERGQSQQAYQLLVASSEALLAMGNGDVWDSGKVVSADATQIPYAGQELLSKQRCYWTVRVWDGAGQVSSWSTPAYWEMGLLQAEDWIGQWIGYPGIGKAPNIRTPLLRKSFQLKQQVVDARLYICGLGYYTCTLNGARVGDHLLDPAQSDFTQTLYYVTYDVTPCCQTGENVIAIALGAGWYSKQAAPSYGVVHDGPVLICQLHLTYANGTRKIIASDADWKTALSPSTPLGTFHLTDAGGEYYDAREELPGWEHPGFDDTGWFATEVVRSPLGALKCQMVEPNRRLAEITPLAIIPQGTRYLLDMGRCFTGWLHIRLPRGTAGQQITFRYGDCLSAEGMLDGIYGQQDIYVMAGNTNESWCSQFNYHAFRYVEIENYPGEPQLAEFTGYLIGTDVESAGSFHCSNDLLNQINAMERWTYQSCLLGGVPVDTPQRERLGYGMDGANAIEQAICNLNMPAVLTKWAHDWQESQDPLTGSVPHVAPYRVVSGGGPGWGSACVLIPWNLYCYYGDQRALHQHYPTMRRWLTFLDGKMRDHLIEHYKLRSYGGDQWEFLGEWIPPRGDMTLPMEHWPSREDNVLFNNLFHYWIVTIVSKVASLLGHTDDARQYSEQAQLIKEAINARFYQQESGKYGNGDQSYQALALEVGVVPESEQAKVLQHLLHDIQVTRQGHLDTGLHGTKALFTALRQAEHSDILYTIATQRTFPSWGDMIAQGATTIWEQWHPGDSRIHTSLVTLSEWLYKGLAGINYDPAAPGFQHIIIKPAVVGDLTFVNASYHSMHGEIHSAWQREGDRLQLTVTIPPNTTARVYIPTDDFSSISLDGIPLAKHPDVTDVCNEAACIVSTIKSGDYCFISKLVQR